MLLAAGVYPRFINAIAEISRFRYRKDSIIGLGLIVISAATAILLCAGPVKNAVVDHRWAMYSLFIGLTLGGVPVLWNIARPSTPRFWVWGGVGLLLMIALAWLQLHNNTASASQNGIMVMFIAGMLGAAAMVLPGISGGYLLLLLGVYVPILGALHTCKEALSTRDFASAAEPIWHIIFPTFIGIVIGIVVISNLIKSVLERYESETLGTLMGLLIGAVLGLWPFQKGTPPLIGTMFKGQLVTPESLVTIPPEKYPTVFYTPSVREFLLALCLIAAGLLITTTVARLGADKTA